MWLRRGRGGGVGAPPGGRASTGAPRGCTSDRDRPGRHLSPKAACGCGAGEEAGLGPRRGRQHSLVGTPTECAPVTATAPDADALVVDDLVVRFGGLTAVDGVSLRVDVGHAVGLIGPNGAGKTTTFNACSGLVTPASGRITLFG